MRGRTVLVKASASCCERTTRSSVWQPTQLRSSPFCWSVPGTLAIHSPLESCAARSAVFLSLRSSVAAGLEFRRGKAVAAFLVAHDGDRDGRARVLRADQHALHCAFFGGADFAGERGLRGGAGGIGGERDAQDRRRDERMCSRAHGRLPGNVFEKP